MPSKIFTRCWFPCPLPPPEESRRVSAMREGEGEGPDSDATKPRRRRRPEPDLRVLELGAGVGLTGIRIASNWSCIVSLTDLDDALPLLERNACLNRDGYVYGPDAVSARRLAWGDGDDWKDALNDLLMMPSPRADVDVNGGEGGGGGGIDVAASSSAPILVLGADVVYFESLHLPLEQTLAYILSSAPVGSICVLAGARRWKSDNRFYTRLGKSSRTDTHALHCTQLEERVKKTKNGGRDVMRLYCIRWLPRKR